jgi:hypothetical protein
VHGQTGTFLHELGHNLGLSHGGKDDNLSYKPNQLSIMNYNFQWYGVLKNNLPKYIYSEITCDDLNENSLNEFNGNVSAV